MGPRPELDQVNSELNSGPHELPTPTPSDGERKTEERDQPSKPKDDVTLPQSRDGKEDQLSRPEDSDAGNEESSPQGETAALGHGISEGGATPTSRFSEATESAIEIVKILADPRNMKRFFIDIFLFEIIGKQIPLALALALPVMAMDVVIGLVIKPQNELIFEDDAHRRMNNASFNVHLDYNPGPQEPGVLGSYVPGHICFLLALWGWFAWVLLYVPYVVLSKEDFAACTPKRFCVATVLLEVFDAVFLIIGGMNAGKVDGPHQYALVGSLSPAIPLVLGFFVLVYWRGKLINAVTKTNLWLVGLVICAAAALTVTLEVIYVVGMGGVSRERRELIIFLYRAIVWPLIWYVLLIPLFRYTLLMTGGDTANVIPFLAFVLGISSVSSRTIMYAVDNQFFFLILAVEDAMLQSMFNFYHKGQPLADQLILSKIWKRCLKLSNTGEVAKHDDSRARLIRMYWFQAQSVVELTVIFSQTLRTWAFYESRHVFALMFRPKCDKLDGFDWNSVLTKLAISVVMVTASDLGSSYFVYCKGFPLSEAFHMLLRKARSWVSFSFMNFCGFCLLAMTMMPVMGRVGNCDDFNNGCSCAGLAVYQELCGCCGLTDEQAAASDLAICRL